MTLRALQLTAVLLLLLVGCVQPAPSSRGAESAAGAPSTIEIVPVSGVAWELLNPARGDASPRAATLWGDLNGSAPTGFLARFVDGFSSPAHIHNVSYRAVVIEGSLHNDDPEAAALWMPPGSFWIQPRGEVHITAAQGEANLALVEIDQGPYLVRPPEEAFDCGERPINIDASNVVWIAQGPDQDPLDGLAVAYLWGALQEGQANGTFVRLPAGVAVSIHSRAATCRAVVIQGSLRHADEPAVALEPGSYVGSTGDVVHRVTSNGDEAAILYVRTEGSYELRVDRG